MITVVCPVYNEEKYIEKLLYFFVHAKPDDKELIIMDGNSTDQTKSIVLEWSKKDPRIRLLSNPHKTVPYALNMAIESSSGDPVIRLDAHTVYADDYFEKIMETFAQTGADIVGGPMRATGSNPLQRAVAMATSTRFGIGDSSFHDANHRGFVDTVYLGAWKRNIFNDVGMFDTKMKRNQDDEFHYRAKSKGKKIFLNPEIRSLYYPRDSFTALFSQYYQYGLYKPLVLKKVKSAVKIRHIIPCLFLSYITLIPFLYLLVGKISLLPAALYLILDVFFSFVYARGVKEKFLSLWVYPTLHISYGAGFIAGLRKKN